MHQYISLNYIKPNIIRNMYFYELFCITYYLTTLFYFILSEPFYIINEYACFGNLETVLKNSRQVKQSTVSKKKRYIPCGIDQRRLLTMAKQVADGMGHIASHKVGRIIAPDRFTNTIVVNKSSFCNNNSTRRQL